ncbi:uncharacterized protein LOC128962050 isoform X2 [Oppia nitens]|uniref:uncharacterized protein LOC128962050 isoform X2 n=1 Tax=Oppia nitens TaxID=1686743 RepID=UPI0023DB57C1|nr:uncharacterized protein LOC128962050 isoform X2 [Oppia nitens]
MALLYRFTKLNDRSNTGVFTFIVTRTVTRDVHRDATTKDFAYGYHRWALSFTRSNDKVLGVYLILRNPSPNTKCLADYTLTLLNREHFSKNESFAQKQALFTVEQPAQGVSKWMLLSEIVSRKFGDETAEFLLELSLGNIMTVYETDIQITGGVQTKAAKLETPYFTFGSFDWNISIINQLYSTTGANNDLDQQQQHHQHIQQYIAIVYLSRLTGFEHPCRVQYRCILGDGKYKEDSGILDQISDVGGRIRGFQLRGHSFQDLSKPHGFVRIYLELFCCNAISEAKVPVIRNPSPTINCYDRNKQGWCIETDMEGEHMRLKLFFMDLHSVPRNHLRYISWIAYVVTRDPLNGVRESIVVTNPPHSNYYIQDGIDMGTIMETDIISQQIRDSPKVYLEMEGQLTVHIEWCDSMMLFNHIYHKYDDLSRIHCQQMRREITALTSENYSLERQLLSYQKSISYASTSSSVASPSQRGTTTSLLGQRAKSDDFLHDSVQYVSNHHKSSSQQQQQHHHHYHHQSAAAIQPTPSLPHHRQYESDRHSLHSMTSDAHNY